VEAGGREGETVRIGLVEDHPVVGVGLREQLRSEPGWDLVHVYRSVSEVDLGDPGLDVVLLDLRLDDGTSPGDNIAVLHEHGIPVLAYTAGEDPGLLRAAARAGILGIVRKSEDVTVLLRSIRCALRGEMVATTEWAAAIDGDAAIAEARLTQRELEVLALYASGETAAGVATILEISPENVAGDLAAIRTKYSLRAG